MWKYNEAVVIWVAVAATKPSCLNMHRHIVDRAHDMEQPGVMSVRVRMEGGGGIDVRCCFFFALCLMF